LNRAHFFDAGNFKRRDIFKAGPVEKTGDNFSPRQEAFQLLDSLRKKYKSEGSHIFVLRIILKERLRVLFVLLVNG